MRVSCSRKHSVISGANGLTLEEAFKICVVIKHMIPFGAERVLMSMAIGITSVVEWKMRQRTYDLNQNDGLSRELTPGLIDLEGLLYDGMCCQQVIKLLSAWHVHQLQYLGCNIIGLNYGLLIKKIYFPR